MKKFWGKILSANKILLLVLPFVFCAVIISGCGGNGAQKTEVKNGISITDDLGRQVIIPDVPQRILPLSASFLEPLHAVNGKIIARVAAKTGIPEEDKALPEVGNVYNVNIEKVIEQQPDLIIAYKGMQDMLVPELEKSGIPVIVLDMKTYDEVKNTVSVFGKITKNEQKAAELNAEMDKQINGIRAKLPQETKRIVILHSTTQNVTVQLKGSIAGSAASLLGFENVAEGSLPLKNNPDSTPYSIETLVAQNPDIIFITSMGKLETIKNAMAKNIENNSAWQSLPAVQKNKVFYLPQNMFLLSPGINYPQAVLYMAKLVYPDSFGE